MTLKAVHAYQSATMQRGFGLIDVSLGIISGIGILVGSVILFQNVATQREISQITQTSLSLSSQIRSYARSMERVSDLPGSETAGLVDLDLSVFDVPPEYSARIAATTPLAGADLFTVRVSDLRQSVCERLRIDPRSLGVKVAASECIQPDPGLPARDLQITFER